jgi:16S rRNA (guanine527-N7)-methyltransferase
VEIVGAEVVTTPTHVVRVQAGESPGGVKAAARRAKAARAARPRRGRR